ncbi:MAG: GDSL-type esterase/lipase family protein [Solirubrobacteraceae bacterium]
MSRVYQPPSDTNGCHRSDVAEIRSGPLRVDQRVNIACSGAVTQNIFRSSSGGVGQNGELPQADQLAAVARQTKVKLVVLSIGGNDLGFSSIVNACLQAYETFGPPCQTSQQPVIDAKFPTAMANVGKAVDEIRAAMQSAGYSPSAYRFVMQSYPSAIPRGSEIRVPEIDHNARTNIDGCPVYNSDATWARDSVVSQISNGLKSVAASKGVQFLDLRDFLQGREMCSVSTRLASPLNPPSATTSDWARFLNLSAVVTQGQLQETFHPNAYAQHALGNCLGLLYAQRSNAACDNVPGAGTNGVLLKPSG